MFSLENLLARPVSFQGQSIACSIKQQIPHQETDHIFGKSNSVSDELIRIHEIVKGFNVNKSNAWIYLRSNYGEKLTQNDLIRIANIVSTYTGIKISRDAKRRKVVLLKWFDENWHQIKPVLTMVSF